MVFPADISMKMVDKKRVLVEVIQTRRRFVEVLIDEDDDSSVAIQKVEKMYEDKEFELDEESIEETIYLEQ